MRRRFIKYVLERGKCLGVNARQDHQELDEQVALGLPTGCVAIFGRYGQTLALDAHDVSGLRNA